jgi:transcriptional regulator with XRE-family HTH domain
MPMKNNQQQVGTSIRKLREDKNLLQRELADSAGIPVRTLGRIERGEVDMRLSTLRKIASALNVDIKDLLT